MANNVLLPHSIQAWDNDCWSNKVIEKRPNQRHIPPSKLEQYCLGCWPDLITYRYLPQRLNSHQRRMPHGSLNSSARVAYSLLAQDAYNLYVNNPPFYSLEYLLSKRFLNNRKT